MMMMSDAKDDSRDGGASDDGASRKRPRAASIVTGAEEVGDGYQGGAVQSADEPAAGESGEDDERIQTEEIVPQDKDAIALENAVQEEPEGGEEEEDDEVLVVLELTDFKNHPIFDDHRHLTIEVHTPNASVL